ncbi:unnamed protein product, partial [Closterium sp. NIES-53]
MTSDFARAACPTVPRLLATVVTDLSFESTAASALVAELIEFAAASRLDSSLGIVAQSKFNCPPSVGGECALDLDVLEDRQEDFDCLADAVPHLVAMLLAPKETWMHQTSRPRALTQRANIVDGIWIFKVKRPPGSPPVFKARYVARGFSQRQGVDFFQTFSPTPKMTTLRVLLHVSAQCDYELHSLDFSTAFLQGSLHEEIWLRRPPDFNGSFPADMRMEPPNRDAAPSSTYVPSSNPVSEPDSPNKGNPTDRRGEVREGRRSDVRVGEVEECCPTGRAALPCTSRCSAGRALLVLPVTPLCLPPAALPCLSRRPAGCTLPCPARRTALLVACRPPLLVASPCWPPRRPALPARRPVGRRAALPCPRAALLAVTLPCPGRAPLFPSRAPPCPAHFPSARAPPCPSHRPCL